jgi:hypothetical protein
MALITSIDFQNGIVCPEAYVKITDIKLDFLTNRAWINTNIYKDNDTRIKYPLAPIKTEEFRVYDTSGVNSIQSKFVVNLKKPQVNIPFNLVFKFNGEIIEIKSNVDFTADTNYLENLITAINVGVLSKYITASVYYPNPVMDEGFVPTGIVLLTKPNSVVDGAIGDTIKFEGSCVLTSILILNGVDKIDGDFTKFFIDGESRTELSTTRSRGYRFIKTLPKYSSAFDDMD